MKIERLDMKKDPEVFCRMGKNVELVFDCHNYSELRKAKLAAIEFIAYVII